MKLKVMKLDGSVILPKFAHEHDAGMDLYSLDDVVIAPKHRASIRTGIAMAIPKGYVGLIWDKSGIGQKKGIKTLGGVIDSGFRGEIKVGLVNLSSKAFHIQKGQKIAQILIQKIEIPKIIEVESLDDTSRGRKGFGSTGEF